MIEPSLNIQVQHLGAVKNANIKLKPLTVFVGENSTGKTYSAYLISYIFSKYALANYLSSINSKKFKKFSEIESAITDLNKNGIAIFDLKNIVAKNSNEYFNLICGDVVKNNFKSFLASETVLFDNVEVNLDIENFQETQFSHLSPHFISFNVETCENCKSKGKCESPILTTIDQKALIVKFEKNKNCSKNSNTRPDVYRSVLVLLHRSIFYDVYFLGAERTGMALFYHTKMKKKSSKNDEIQKNLSDPKKTEDTKGEIQVQFSLPVAELFHNVEAIFNPQSGEVRTRKIQNSSEIKKFIEYANILENQILGGDISIKKGKTESKLMFNFHEIPMNMSMTSSGVKGLSPLILYLKYILEPNEMIVIDEPEINLHPKAQVMLIELLAMLANLKVNIIITTHSPYVVDHLINLMKAYSSKKSKKAPSNLFYLKNKDAFISKDNVSVYLFENGTAIDILKDENHINWQTFSQVSDDINNIYFKIEE